MMRIIILAVFFLFSVVPGIHARDFMVSFVEENYKETSADFSYKPLIYHSIQVKTPAGPKILVLEGDDVYYRTWLRQYISEDRRFILKVDPGQTDRFISEKVFKTSVNNLHPVVDPDWKKQMPVPKGGQALTTEDSFLIADTNETRIALLTTVSKKMGFTAIAHQTGDSVIEALKLQPEKFKMIIVTSDLPDTTAQALVEKLVRIKHDIPVLIETGYQDQDKKKRLDAKFGHLNSVHIQPVVLRDLQTTIKKLVKNDVEQS